MFWRVRLPDLGIRLWPDTRAMLVLGLAIQAVGLMFAVWARRVLGKNWSARVAIGAEVSRLWGALSVCPSPDLQRAPVCAARITGGDRHGPSRLGLCADRGIDSDQGPPRGSSVTGPFWGGVRRIHEESAWAGADAVVIQMRFTPSYPLLCDSTITSLTFSPTLL
jgi:hypothetical protein